MIMIVMEMVTAMPVNVNAQLIMSMLKIAHIMDVSRFLYITYCICMNKIQVSYLEYIEHENVATFPLFELQSPSF